MSSSVWLPWFLSLSHTNHTWIRRNRGGSEDQDERQHESVRRGGGDGPLLVVVSKKDFSGCFHKVVFYLDPHHRRPQFPVAHSSIFIPTGCWTGFRLLISSYWNINIFCCSGSKRDANFQGILGVSLKFKSRIAEFVLKLFPRPFIFHFTYGDRIITETFFFFFSSSFCLPWPPSDTLLEYSITPPQVTSKNISYIYIYLFRDGITVVLFGKHQCLYMTNVLNCE